MKRIVYVYKIGASTTLRLVMEFDCNEDKCEVKQRNVDDMIMFMISEGYYIREVIEK